MLSKKSTKMIIKIRRNRQLSQTLSGSNKINKNRMFKHSPKTNKYKLKIRISILMLIPPNTPTHKQTKLQPQLNKPQTLPHKPHPQQPQPNTLTNRSKKLQPQSRPINTPSQTIPNKFQLLSLLIKINKLSWFNFKIQLSWNWIIIII